MALRCFQSASSYSQSIDLANNENSSWGVSRQCLLLYKNSRRDLTSNLSGTYVVAPSHFQIKPLLCRGQWGNGFLGEGSHLFMKSASFNNNPKKIHRTMVAASMPVVGPGNVQMASALFTLGTAFVIPFYTVMILAPHAEWTRKLVESNIPYVILGFLYAYLLALSWTSDTVQLMFASKYWLPELPGIAKMFSSTLTVASAWIHLLAVDLFAGRQVFLDGLQHAVETRHSLVLCLLVCPIGILSHFITKVVTLLSRRANGEKEMADVTALYT